MKISKTKIYIPIKHLSCPVVDNAFALLDNVRCKKKYRAIPQKRFGARNIHLLICLQIYVMFTKSTKGIMKGALEGIFKTHSFICLTSSIKFRGHAIFSIIRLRTLKGY